MEPRKKINNNSLDNPDVAALTMSELVPYFKETYLEHLHHVLRELLTEKQCYLDASSSYVDFYFFKLDCGSLGRRYHRWRARRAPGLQQLYLDQLDDPNHLKTSALMKLLSYMSFDEDFSGIAKRINHFVGTLTDETVPVTKAGCVNMLQQLSNSMASTEAFRYFKSLMNQLNHELDCLQPVLEAADQVIQKGEIKKRQVAEALNTDPDKLKQGGIESQIFAKFPGVLARSPDTSIVHKENSDAKKVLSFKPNVVNFNSSRILEIVRSVAFNPSLREEGVFSRMSRWFSGRPGDGHLSASATLVLRALEDPEAHDVVAALSGFIHCWKEKSAKSPAQVELLKELSGYVMIMKNNCVENGAPGIDMHRERLVQESEDLLNEIRELKYRLKKSYGVRDLVRSKSFAEVVAVCLKSSKRHIIPTEVELNKASLSEVSEFISDIADYLCDDVDHGLMIVDDEHDERRLASTDPNFNLFLKEVYRADLCPSRTYTLLLIGLLIRTLDIDQADAFKHILRQAVAKQHLLKSIHSFKDMPEAFKPYFPEWSGPFLANLVDLRSALWQVSPAAFHDHRLSFRLSELSMHSDKLDTRASLSSPKNADEIDCFSYSDLGRYAKNVCHIIVTQGPIRTKKRKVKEILANILENKAFRPKHESLKFLLAMLMWYREYKVQHKIDSLWSTKHLDELVDVKNSLTRVINSIDTYLRKDAEADHLCLYALFDKIKYKRGENESFAKLLQFASAVEYRDEHGRVLCDLRDEQSQCVIPSSKTGWLRVGLFKSSAKKSDSLEYESAVSDRLSTLSSGSRSSLSISRGGSEHVRH